MPPDYSNGPVLDPTPKDQVQAAAGLILDALIQVYPNGLDREELATRAGLTASGGMFGAAVGMLHRYALLEPNGRRPRMIEVLVGGVR